METHQLYAAGVGGFLFLLGLLRILKDPRVLSLTFRFFVYPLFQYINLTLLEALSVLTFVILGVILIGLEKAFLPNVAFLFAINLIPLFVSELVADFLGISLHTYTLIHRWVGTVAFIQGLVHAIAVSRRGNATVSQTATGATTAVFLSLATVEFLFRRLKYQWCLQLHHILAPMVLGVLVWHLLVTSISLKSMSWISVYFSGALWVCGTLVRRLFLLYRGAVHASIVRIDEAAWVTVPVNPSKKMFPGAFFYIYFTKYPLLKVTSDLHPVLIWRHKADTKLISFLMPEDQIPSENIEAICLDGPYGQDLCVGSYGTVILVAEDFGIAGVLSFAFSLVTRKKYCDKVQKVDLFWKISSNSNLNWALKRLQSLLLLDRSSPVLLLCVIYPNEPPKTPPPKFPKFPKSKNTKGKKTRKIPKGLKTSKKPIAANPPKESSNNWMHVSGSRYPECIHIAIETESLITPGETMVVSCGSAVLNRKVRELTRTQITPDNIIRYHQLQYVPPPFTSRKTNKPTV